MACSCPLYRLECKGTEARRLPPRLKRKIRYDALVCNYSDYQYLVNVLKFSKSQVQTIPCGQCIDCRLEYSRQWAVRCMHEAEYYQHNYFLTITYSDDNLPREKFLELYNGTIFEQASLRKSDIQKFMKDVRSYYDYHYGHQGVRFFGAGEYSPEKFRPHYHCIMFNFPVDDLKYYGISKSGYRVYTSQKIQNIWDKGYIWLGEVTSESCAYTAQYSLKKVKGKAKKERDEVLKRLVGGHEDLLSQFESRVDEFTFMSRRPGIGRRFYDDNKHKIYTNDEMFIKQRDNVIKLKPVRYYDKIFDMEFPEEMQRIKDIRQALGDSALQQRLKDTNMTEEQYNILREQIHRRKYEKQCRDTRDIF